MATALKDVIVKELKPVVKLCLQMAYSPRSNFLSEVGVLPGCITALHKRAEA